MRRRSLSKAIARHNQKLAKLSPSEKQKLDNVRIMAIELMNQYLDKPLIFCYGYGWRYLGLCSSTKITLQLNFVLESNLDDIKNVLLHEIAHAIVGTDKAHRIEWQNKAIELGVHFTRKYRK